MYVVALFKAGTLFIFFIFFISLVLLFFEKLQLGFCLFTWLLKAVPFYYYGHVICFFCFVKTLHKISFRSIDGFSQRLTSSFYVFHVFGKYKTLVLNLTDLFLCFFHFLFCDPIAIGFFNNPNQLLIYFDSWSFRLLTFKRLIIQCFAIINSWVILSVIVLLTLNSLSTDSWPWLSVRASFSSCDSFASTALHLDLGIHQFLQETYLKRFYLALTLYIKNRSNSNIIWKKLGFV